MNNSAGSLTMLIAGASDALCIDVSGQLARALDRDPTSGVRDADWSANAGDGGGRPFEVDVSRLPYAREDPARRGRLLAASDVIVLVVDAMESALPAAVAGLSDVRDGLGDRRCPLVVFGLGGASSGLDAEAVRRHLELADHDTVILGAASDRDRLRQVFAFAVRAALTPPHTPEAPSPAPPMPAPSSSPEAEAPAIASDDAPPVPPAPEPTEPVAPTEVQIFGSDDAFIEAILNPGAINGRGVVEIAASDWESLTELVGRIALIRGSGDDRREALVRELMSRAIIVDRRQAAPAGDVDLFNQPRSAPVGASTPEAVEVADLDDAQSVDDRFRALKELRRQLLG